MKALTVPDPALSPPTKRKPKAKEEAGPSADPAWTGEGEAQMDFTVGEVVFMLNPYFRDGTRLRLDPVKESAFTGQHILNDAECEILELSIETGFAKVREVSGLMGWDADSERPRVEGWGARRNLVRMRRQSGLGLGLSTPAPAHPFRPRRRQSARRANNVVRVAAGLLLEVSRQTAVHRTPSFAASSTRPAASGRSDPLSGQRPANAQRRRREAASISDHDGRPEAQAWAVVPL